MIAIICAALSGAFFFLSGGVGEVWPVAWLAAAPVLWLAYGKERGWRVAAAAFVAFAIGQMNLILTYWSVLPFGTLAVILFVPPIAFAAAVLFGRFASRRLPPLTGALAFPAFWTTIEYFVAINSPDGTAGSFAYSQAGVPQMIQSASLFGLASITFLLMLNSSLLAMAFRRPQHSPLLTGVAIALFGLNALFGMYRLDEPPSQRIRVAMIDSDALNDAAFSSEFGTALHTVNAYVASAYTAIKDGAQVVVMPEKMAVLEQAWRDEALAPLVQAANANKVTIIAGFDSRGLGRRNVALIFRPNVPVYEYDKRHMVPGLEKAFQPGLRSGVFAPGWAVAICKDMDFADMMRADAASHIRVMFVPAWDFGADGWAHARMAIMRGVEGGYAVVRSARLGYLTATDAKGRIVAGAPTSSAGFVSVSANVPLGPGDTVYLHIGDVFAWMCVGLTIGLFVVAFLPRRREPEPAAEVATEPKTDSNI